ncbi:hypothetical protein COLINT_02395 [Collinsella intestinalis DSM 13280]|uniref:Uncharacterized protein n=1 Tax=Collinsella intestinalis DSM 13280 TaxID=521003 RepID=C4F8M4_9ACTN|nr:hypothetical protein COLINT_02395 [Collinsella intestinalis DSM 13280]
MHDNENDGRCRRAIQSHMRRGGYTHTEIIVSIRLHVNESTPKVRWPHECGHRE